MPGAGGARGGVAEMTVSAERPARILVVSTNGVMRDGITEWMVQYFSHMDLSGLEVDAVAWKNTDPTLISRVRQIGIGVRFVSPRNKDVLRYAQGLYRVVKERGYDIIHICGNSGTVALELAVSWLAGVSNRIVHAHSTSCTHVLLDKALRPLMKTLSTYHFACGEMAGKWLFGDAPYSVLPNGKDPCIYSFNPDKRTQARTALGLNDDGYAIGHVGAMVESKNHTYLLDVFHCIYGEAPNSRLFLIGDGPLRSELYKKVKNLGIEDAVSFLGYREDVPFLLQGMDCMIFPSYYEGVPNVVVEWQLSGLPSVISDTITEECCFTNLVTRMPLSAQPEKWAKQALRLSKSSYDRGRKSSGAAARAMENGFDINEDVSILRETYKRMLDDLDG